LIHADGISDVEVFGYQLADWIIKNNVVEQIFGPNLHVEVGIFALLFSSSNQQIIISFLFLNWKVNSILLILY